MERGDFCLPLLFLARNAKLPKLAIWSWQIVVLLKNHQRDPSLLSSIRKQYFGLSKSKIVKIGWIRSSDEIFLFSVVVFPSD